MLLAFQLISELSLRQCKKSPRLNMYIKSFLFTGNCKKKPNCLEIESKWVSNKND